MPEGDRFFHIGVAACAATVLLLMGALVVTLALGGVDAFRAFGFGFLTHPVWNPVTDQYGALAPLFGTVASTLIAIAFGVPLAFGTAFWLTSVAPPFVAKVIGTGVQLLAAVPSIIYSMWGFFVIVPFISHRVQPYFRQHFTQDAFIQSLVHGAPFGYGLMTAGLVLAVMIVPFMTAVMRDVFAVIPPMLSESAYALGATRFEVLRHIVVPWSRKGLVGGLVLGLGRALGETMAVTFVIGNVNTIGWSLFAPRNTVASLVALEFPESPSGSLKLSALLALGFLLMILSLSTLGIARWFLKEEKR